MMGHRRFGALAVAGLVMVGAAACEPAPPRLQLTVDSTLAGADDDPGDGTCSSAAAGGACTLHAAIDEGNAAPDGADLTVPAGHYRNVDATITGDVTVSAQPAAEVAITESTFTVAVGARLIVSGINTSTTIQAVPPVPGQFVTTVKPLFLDVAGSAGVVGSILGRLDVAAGAGAVVVDSIVTSLDMTNHGRLLMLRSTLLGVPEFGPAATVLTTDAGAFSSLASSVVAVPHVTIDLGAEPIPGGEGTCAGAPPISKTYMFVEVPCGPMDEIGDGSGDAGTTAASSYSYNGIGYYQIGMEYGLRATSPLVDAIPMGEGTCDPGAVDVYGHPRGVDGNGDGVGGCDIGAVERQP
jgi:hypothetical protein